MNKQLLFAGILYAFVGWSGLLLTGNVQAQAVNWVWAKDAGDNGGDYGKSICTDASGNVYVTGSFQSSTITFGSYIFSNNSGGSDMYIVKYDPNGNVLWAKREGGSGSDDASGISIDTAGNLFITGYFSSPVITFGTTTLTNPANGDIFVVKYDSNGNVLWAKSGGGPDIDVVSGISADASGNVFITGYFYGSAITFDNITLANNNPGMQNPDVFVVKYDSNGSVLWAKSAGGTQTDYGRGISTDASGNVVVTGEFWSSTLNFGTVTLNKTGSSYGDIFVVKYDALGNVLWTKKEGSSNHDEGLGISTDTNGNVLVTGAFYGSTITFGSITLTNGGGGSCTGGCSDVFVVKYNASGNVIWAKGGGGSFDHDEGTGISVDVNGNVLVTGYYRGNSITFGSTTLINTACPAGGCADVFVVKYDASSGNVLWAKSAGGNGDDEGSSITTDLNGDVFVTGHFYSFSISFGNAILNNTNIFSNIFVVKIGTLTGTFETTGNPGVISIYPNPFNTKTVIDMKDLGIGIEDLELQIYDVCGQIVFHYEIDPGSLRQYEIHRGNLPAGIYLYQVKNERVILEKGKIIIQ